MRQDWNLSHQFGNRTVGVVFTLHMRPCYLHVYRSHLLMARWSHSSGLLSSKQQLYHYSSYVLRIFSAICVPTACSSEEEDPSMLWKRRGSNDVIKGLFQNEEQQLFLFFSAANENVSITSSYLMMFSMHALWRKNALMTGVPGGTRGALQRKARTAKTLWKDWNSFSPCGWTVTRWQSSVRITRSRIIGLASRESCYTKYIITKD